jgi:glycosyltransferase involved in cell wall biosynthesis
MRVLHVLPSIAPSHGGPSSALIGLSQALSERDVDSETITTDLGHDDEHDLKYGRLVEFNGVNVRYFPRLFPTWLPRDFALSPQLARWLKAHIRNYDIVNIHGLFSYPNSIAAHIAYRAGVPFVIRPCGMLDPWCLKQGRIKKSAYLKLFDKNLLRHAAAISFTTEEEAKLAYRVKHQSNGVVIPLGVKLIEDGSQKQEDFPFPGDKKIILFLSRLDQKKGLDLLLPSLVRLGDARDDFLCVIAGSGDETYEAKIKAEVKTKKLEDVVWLSGFVKGNQKYQLLKRAHCFVLPSYQENFGISVVEAMSAGCPVIISDQVNIHREVSDSCAGRVVRCDVDEIFSALDELLSDEAMRQKMGINGQKLVQEKYNWDTISERVLSLYQTCIEQNSSRFNRYQRKIGAEC